MYYQPCREKDVYVEKEWFFRFESRFMPKDCIGVMK